MERAVRLFPMAVTPYALALIDPENARCPLRRQMIPSERELKDRLGMMDPLDETLHSPVPDCIHLYPDRVALCVSRNCAMYCRFCFRKRRTHENVPADAFEQALAYIEKTPRIRDVLVTGGDPLMLPDRVLLDRLARLHRIPHVQILRVGTRTPAMLPMRITPALVRGLKRLQPIYVNVQFNHPRELTAESKKALAMLADAGIPLGNQSVLLKGVNDTLAVMRRLVHELLENRVRPYYLFHPHLVEGTEHFRPPIEVGLKIMEGLEGYTSGLASPQYAIDTPHGKVPLTRQRIIRRTDSEVVVRTYDGHVWHEANPRKT